MHEFQFQNEQTDEVLHDVSFGYVCSFISACDELDQLTDTMIIVSVTVSTTMGVLPFFLKVFLVNLCLLLFQTRSRNG